MALMSFIMAVATVFGVVIPEDVKAVGNDIIMYKVSMSAVFLSIGIVFSICLGGFDKKRLVSCGIILLVGMIVCGICFNNVSDGFVSSINSSATVTDNKAPVLADDDEEAGTVCDTKDNIEEEVPTENESQNENVTAVNDSEDAAYGSGTVGKNDTGIDSEKCSVYEALSDEEFAHLTKYLAKSFYSFTLDTDDYNEMMTYPDVVECIKMVYDYAYNNCWELDPSFESILSKRINSVSSIPEWDIFIERFMLERRYDNKTGEWVYDINSYSIDPESMFLYDDGYYLDAEGYLGIGCILYWENEGKMERVGTVVDIARNKEIDGTVYAYAVNVDYEIDEASDGWHNGEALLSFNKRFGGNPIYYVSATDTRRSFVRESIDYSGNIVWTRLNERNACVGTEVYFGLYSAKSYSFTIVWVDAKNDLMLVEYPSGTIEEKSYSAMLKNDALFVK